MSTLSTIFMLTVVLALAAINSATSDEEEEPFFEDPDTSSSVKAENTEPAESKKPVSLRGASRFLEQRARLTCDKYPKACESKGSSTRDNLCCNKKCVNVKVDKLNCGACGKRCKFSEICCNGRCVNPSANKNHCGGCGNSCQEGDFCAFGMCSYSYA
ncbi:hypothetical protein AAG906_001943 [Vitis piasezkii]